MRATELIYGFVWVLEISANDAHRPSVPRRISRTKQQILISNSLFERADEKLEKPFFLRKKIRYRQLAANIRYFFAFFCLLFSEIEADWKEFSVSGVFWVAYFISEKNIGKKFEKKCWGHFFISEFLFAFFEHSDNLTHFLQKKSFLFKNVAFLQLRALRALWLCHRHSHNTP